MPPRSHAAAYGLALSRLGTLARRNGNPAQALALHSRAVLLLRSQPRSAYSPSILPMLLGTLLELSRDQAQVGRIADSRATLVEIVQVLDTEFPTDFPDLVNAYFELASRTSERDEIRRLLRRGAALLARIYGDNDPRALAARKRLDAHDGACHCT